MHIRSENNYSFLFIANLSLCVSLSPWKVWIQGLRGSLARLTRCPTPTRNLCLRSHSWQTADIYFQTGAPQFPVNCATCTYPILPKHLEIGSYHQIVSFWPVAQGIGMILKPRSTEDFGDIILYQIFSINEASLHYLMNV